MSVNAKHLATFLLGAAAGYGAYKYSKLSDEEKEKLMADLKTKANNMKDEAEGAVDKAKEYFEELKTKGSGALKDQVKDHLKDAENLFNELFGSKKDPEPGATAN
jgi:hypothetical protein